MKEAIIIGSEHYYSNKPTSAHNYQEFEARIRDVKLKLITDAGIFSKDRLDPGTKLLIEALPLDPNLKKVFDLGCGYGPIGLTIAKLLPGSTIYMSDINERAVELGIKNAQLNGITNVVIKPGDGFEAFSDEKFDLIVTNPPIRAGKQIIYGLIDQAYQALNNGGRLVLVIKTKHGAKSMEAKLNSVFKEVTELEKGGGYRVYGSRK
ncbi:MAG: class I SAM-dependent methyltransferase [Bacteroidota bacterium]